MEKEFRNLLSRHGKPVSADVLMDVLDTEDGENYECFRLMDDSFNISYGSGGQYSDSFQWL